MTGNGGPRARWTNNASWATGQPGDIVLAVALAQEPHEVIEVLLTPASAQQLVLVLTRLLMERDQELQRPRTSPPTP